MKTMKLPLIIGIVLLVALACVSVVSACDYGCTPGYWKSPKVLAAGWPCLNPYWDMGWGDLNGDGQHDTFLDALQYKGGSGDIGAERILLRAETAANLNLCAFGSGYPLYGYPPPWQEFDNIMYHSTIVGQRDRMINLAGYFDYYNNGVCQFD